MLSLLKYKSSSSSFSPLFCLASLHSFPVSERAARGNSLKFFKRNVVPSKLDFTIRFSFLGRSMDGWLSEWHSLALPRSHSIMIRRQWAVYLLHRFEPTFNSCLPSFVLPFFMLCLTRSLNAQPLFVSSLCCLNLTRPPFSVLFWHFSSVARYCRSLCHDGCVGLRSFIHFLPSLTFRIHASTLSHSPASDYTSWWSSLRTNALIFFV